MDLKPENIMVNEKTRKIKIIDFGSSKYKKEKLELYSNFYVQTRYYRAPEIFFKMRYNEKIDMWSYGCIIGELLIDFPLFYGKTKQVLIHIINKLGYPKDRKYMFSNIIN